MKSSINHNAFNCCSLMRRCILGLVVLGTVLRTTESFCSPFGCESSKRIRGGGGWSAPPLPVSNHQEEDDSILGEFVLSRRQTGQLLTGFLAGSVPVCSVQAEESVYKAAVRARAYRVDSTVPPTLLPLTPGKQKRVLSALAKGSGTDKKAIIVDTLNLNNMLNKAVFGSVDAITNIKAPGGPPPPSFVCLGVHDSEKDAKLALNLMQPLLSRDGATAVGIWFVPYSCQEDLDAFVSGKLSLSELKVSLLSAGVGENLISNYEPVLELCKATHIDLLALSPEFSDLQLVRRDGLQNVDVGRRARYVMDPDGFIAMTQDQKFKVYTDRSLLKDFAPSKANEKPGNFFSERILVHEAAASAISRYAAEQPVGSLVVSIAPTKDLRFLNGINGRIPRVCQLLLDQQESQLKVSEDSVTTILLNPTATATLSKSRYLRLEVGTSPDVLDYQSKVADYLWFDSSPKVNLISRLMDG